MLGGNKLVSSHHCIIVHTCTVYMYIHVHVHVYVEHAHVCTNVYFCAQCKINSLNCSKYVHVHVCCDIVLCVCVCSGGQVELSKVATGNAESQIRVPSSHESPSFLYDSLAM